MEEVIEVDEFGEIIGEGASNEALALRTVDAEALMMPSNSVTNIVARRDAIQEFVSQFMVEGVHYGQIPGTKEKCLWLSGAEGLAAYFGLQVDFSLQEKIADRQSVPPYFEYRYKAVVRKGQDIIVSCEGVCNNHEDCFKVWVITTPPSKEKQEEMLRNKTGKWDAWEGKENWKEKMDPPNHYGIINNIAKRAQKRAYVGAIERATGVSGFFAKAARTSGNKPNNKPAPPAARPAPAPSKIISSPEINALHQEGHEKWIASGEPAGNWSAWYEKWCGGKSAEEIRAVYARKWPPVIEIARTASMDEILSSIERLTSSLIGSGVSEPVIYDKIMGLTFGQAMIDCSADTLENVLDLLEDWDKDIKK